MVVQFMELKPFAKTDRSWVKARIAARLILRKKSGQVFSLRDRRMGSFLKNDPAVTNQLLDQAVACRCVKVGISYEKLVRSALESQS
jgi:hypothetical protein